MDEQNKSGNPYNEGYVDGYEDGIRLAADIFGTSYEEVMELVSEVA